MLETSSLRREGLGKALRLKLEQEVSRLREENMGLKGVYPTLYIVTSENPTVVGNYSQQRALILWDVLLFKDTFELLASLSTGQLILSILC